MNALVWVCYCFEISSLLNKQGIVLLTKRPKDFGYEIAVHTELTNQVQFYLLSVGLPSAAHAQSTTPASPKRSLPAKIPGIHATTPLPFKNSENYCVHTSSVLFFKLGHPLFSPTQIFAIFKKKKSNDIVKSFFTWNNSFNPKNEHSNSIEKKTGTKTWTFFTVYCVFC